MVEPMRSSSILLLATKTEYHEKYDGKCGNF